MASAFGHAASAWAISRVFGLKHKVPTSLLVTGIVLSIFPDADVLGFKLGIEYGSLFGHRGFTHSIFFAVVLAGLITPFFKKTAWPWFAIFSFLFICCVSHAVLDACTTGGKGVAFFSPFSNERMFLPFRVIKVSPLSISQFFGEWGKKVVLSELIWIGVPCLVVYALTSTKKIFD